MLLRTGSKIVVIPLGIIGSSMSKMDSSTFSFGLQADAVHWEAV